MEYEEHRYYNPNTQRVGIKKFLPQISKREDDEKMSCSCALEMAPTKMSSPMYKSCTLRILRSSRTTYQKLKWRGEEMNSQMKREGLSSR